MFWEEVATIVMMMLLILGVTVLGMGAIFACELIADIIRMRRRK